MVTSRDRAHPGHGERGWGRIDALIMLRIEQPIEFEPVIDVESARAPGLAIPSSLPLRADRVIA